MALSRHFSHLKKLPRLSTGIMYGACGKLSHARGDNQSLGCLMPKNSARMVGTNAAKERGGKATRVRKHKCKP